MKKSLLPCLTVALMTACSAASPPPAANPPPPGAAVQPVGFPDTAAGRAAGRLLSSAHVFGADAEAQYQKALTALREVGDEAVTVLVDSYRAAAAADYPRRRNLVAMLAALEMTAAGPALIAIAAEPIPVQATPTPHGLDPSEEEVLIRVAAVSGIGRLASTRRAPIDPLFDLLTHPERPVREEAARTLTTAADQLQLGTDVLARIPQDLRFDRPPSNAQPIAPQDADPRLRPKNRDSR